MTKGLAYTDRVLEPLKAALTVLASLPQPPESKEPTPEWDGIHWIRKVDGVDQPHDHEQDCVTLRSLIRQALKQPPEPTQPQKEQGE